MIKYESKASILFRHWLRANPQKTCSYEIKDARGKDYLNFSEVKQEQIDYALAIQSDRGVLMRTVAVSTGMPDYLYMRKEKAYIVIKFKSGFVIIPIQNFLACKTKSKRRSLTFLEAMKIGRGVVKV